MLTTDTNTPEVSETPVAADLLQPLEVVTELRVDIVRQNLAVLAVDDIFLPVKEPEWNLELCGVLHDVHDSFKLVRVQVTSADKRKYKEGVTLVSNYSDALSVIEGILTVSSSRHRPFCRQCSSSDDPHP